MPNLDDGDILGVPDEWMIRMVVKPPYKRPAELKDFQGRMVWTKRLSRHVGGMVYHACHLDRLDQYLKTGRLSLASRWNYVHPGTGRILWRRGIWVGLNEYSEFNKFGPFVLKFDARLLVGRTFMVFHRNEDRDRYFFVEYLSNPPFSDGKRRRTCNPLDCFNDGISDWPLRRGAIYDIVLRRAISQRVYSVRTVVHPRCSRCGEGEPSGVRELLRKRRKLIRNRYD